MKTKDYLIVVFVPLALLLIPLVGNLTVEGWHWSLGDFVLMGAVLAATTFVYRLLATRPPANLTYRLGAGLAVVTGFLLTWVNLAVQVIGDDNPGNLLYFLVLLAGLVGVFLSGFKPAALARVAFGMAGAIFLIPLIAVLAWPTDFNPGFAKVLMLNFGFVLMFAASGILLRRSAHASSRPTTA